MRIVIGLLGFGVMLAVFKFIGDRFSVVRGFTGI